MFQGTGSKKKINLAKVKAQVPANLSTLVLHQHTMHWPDSLFLHPTMLVFTKNGTK